MGRICCAPSPRHPRYCPWHPRRTLPLYQELRRLKAHCLAEPDVLICGVGTRIYHRGEAGGGARGYYHWITGQAWRGTGGAGWWMVDGRRGGARIG